MKILHLSMVKTKKAFWYKTQKLFKKADKKFTLEDTVKYFLKQPIQKSSYESDILTLSRKNDAWGKILLKQCQLNYWKR